MGARSTILMSKSLEQSLKGRLKQKIAAAAVSAISASRLCRNCLVRKQPIESMIYFFLWISHNVQ